MQISVSVEGNNETAPSVDYIYTYFFQLLHKLNIKKIFFLCWDPDLSNEWISLLRSTKASDCFILVNIVHLAARHTCFQTECNCDREKFMAEKTQDKHSISLLGDMLLCLQRKWKDNLSGCKRTAGSNLIISPTYCDSEFDLFISVKQTIRFSSYFDIQWKH